MGREKNHFLIGSVVIFYWCITNYHKCRGLKQHTFIMSVFPRIRSLGIAKLGPLPRTTQACNQKCYVLLRGSAREDPLLHSLSLARGIAEQTSLQKGRNGKDLTEAEEIKKTWQDDTEELCKKGLNYLDNRDAVVTHLKLDALECEDNWALGSITTNKAGGGDRIPAELAQILKDDAVKVLYSTCQQIWKAQQWPLNRKSQFSLQPKRRAMSKNVQAKVAIALISHSSKVMLKILQATLQQHMNQGIPCVQTGFRKGIRTWDQIANGCWIMEKAREFWKNIYFCFSDYAKAFDCVDHNKLWEILKRDGNTIAPDLPPEKSMCR